MERPLFKSPGTPVRQLDTPALVVDLGALEHNLETVHAFFRQREAKLRPHVSAHRCPAIAHRQLAAGGTLGGISVTTVGEAEVFATHGFTDILVVNEVVTAHKIRRLCALARQVTLTVAVDQPQQVANLSAAAQAYGVTLRVVVDIQTHPDRCGVLPGRPALELARAVSAAPHLEFAGLMTTGEARWLEDTARLDTQVHQSLQPILDTRSRLEASGVPVRMVSVGGTSTYERAATLDGITEVRAGTYALMDARHRPSLQHLQVAARVLTTISSYPEPGTLVTDAGQKAIGIDLGLPVVADLPGASAERLSAEHCCIQLDEHAEGKVALGDKLWLIPWDIGTCANLYDTLHAGRHGVLETVWPVSARGQYR